MRKSNVKAAARVVLTSLYILIAVFLQTGLFPYFTLLGAVPNLVLCAVVCVSIFENERVSCITALLAGFLLDTVGGGATLSPLLFVLAASCSIFFSRKVLRPGITSAMLSAAAALAADALITALIIVVTQNGASFPSALLRSSLPGALYSAIVFFPTYLLTRLHYRIFKAA